MRVVSKRFVGEFILRIKERTKREREGEREVTSVNQCIWSSRSQVKLIG